MLLLGELGRQEISRQKKGMKKKDLLANLALAIVNLKIYANLSEGKSHLRFAESTVPYDSLRSRATL